jgi:hypothetical protein
MWPRLPKLVVESSSTLRRASPFLMDMDKIGVVQQHQFGLKLREQGCVAMPSARTHGRYGPKQFSDATLPPIALGERHLVVIVPDGLSDIHALNLLAAREHALFGIAHSRSLFSSPVPTTRRCRA